MFAQLGDIRFDLITYFDSLDAHKKVDYVEHATIEGKPKLQYIAESLETLDIKLTFHVGFCNPADELKRLKEVASKYEPLPFIFGNGIYKGDYVIEEISESVKQTFTDSTLLAIEVNLKLKEFVKYKPLGTKKEKSVKKKGTKSPKPENQSSIEKGSIVRQKK